MGEILHMKKTTLLAAMALLSLTSCGGENNVPESQNMTDLKAAQKVEHDKGAVGFDVNGSFSTKITQGDKQLEKINVTGISGKAVFERLPEQISELSFALLQRLNARLELSCASLDIKYNAADESHKTVIEMVNPAVTVGLNSNSAAFGVTKETIEGVFIDGKAIENPADCVWKVNPWMFNSDFDLPSFDSSAFSTYAGVLFSFKSVGGYTRASLDIDFDKASQLYVGVNTALWMQDNPGDVNDPEYKKEVGNMQELFKEDIAGILDKDFDFSLWIDYEASRGINQFGIDIDGEINVNYLNARTDADLVNLDLDVELTFKETGTATFEAFTGASFVNVR